MISIHALREEGDHRTARTAGWLFYFYPRPPRGGRLTVGDPSGPESVFLSTPSARRATVAFECLGIPVCNFYPRPPRGGRLSASQVGLSAHKISIHALREEGDLPRMGRMGRRDRFLSTPSARRATQGLDLTVKINLFLSTPSARRATSKCCSIWLKYLISIHALREEGDSKNGEKHLRFCFIIKRSAQIWKSLSKNIRKRSCDLHRTA